MDIEINKSKSWHLKEGKSECDICECNAKWAIEEEYKTACKQTQNDWKYEF